MQHNRNTLTELLKRHFDAEGIALESGDLAQEVANLLMNNTTAILGSNPAQSQESLSTQLEKLAQLANKAGYYDAADHITKQNKE